MDPIALIKTFLLVSIVFIPLERLFALRRDQKIFRRGWIVNLTHVVLTGLAIQLCNVSIITLISEFVRQSIPGDIRHAISNQPIWIQYIEILVIADLGSYAMHRAFHAVPWLWRFHAVRHSSEQLDYLASYRVHPIDQLLVRSVTLIPAFSLGFDGAAFAIFAVIYHWQAMLLHSNTRFHFGGLERIVASPCFHHWHHAKDVRTGRNFAGQLAVLDWLLGTFSMPGNKLPDGYGIDEPMPNNYFMQMTKPLRPNVSLKDYAAPTTNRNQKSGRYGE